MPIFKLINANKENWEISNPILNNEEFGVAIDKDNEMIFKKGDGETPWNSLRALNIENYSSDEEQLLGLIGEAEIK